MIFFLNRSNYLFHFLFIIFNSSFQTCTVHDCIQSFVGCSFKKN